MEKLVVITDKTATKKDMYFTLIKCTIHRETVAVI